MKYLAIAAALMTILAAGAMADWPQLYGPNRDGISIDTTKLAETWPADGPPVLWKLNDTLGTGYGGAVVQGGKVFLLDRVADRQDVLRCIDLATGTQEWTFDYFAPAEAKDNPKAGQYKGAYNGSRNMPAVDEQNVYILGPFGDLHCISRATHTPLWSHNLVQKYGSVVSNWGLCQSPVLYRDMVIVAPASPSTGIVAFDKTTGHERWKSAPIGGMAWTSPAISTVDGVDQVVMLVNRNSPRLVGLNAATGTELWRYQGWKCANPIASQTDCGQGRFFITGGYGAGCAMVQVSRQGDGWQVVELFKNRECGAQACTPIFYKDHIYAKSNDTLNSNRNGLMCMDLTGQVKWAAGDVDSEELGSILIADGKLLNLLSERGVLQLVQASENQYKPLASATILAGTNAWAPMALSDGKLLVRKGRSLICFDLSANHAAGLTANAKPASSPSAR